MKCNYKRRANFSLSGHVMRQLVRVVGLQIHHVVGCNVERTTEHLRYLPDIGSDGAPMGTKQTSGLKALLMGLHNL